MGKETRKMGMAQRGWPRKVPMAWEQQSTGAREGQNTPTDESFSAILRRQFYRSGISLTQLARRSWLDIGYLSRLISQDHDPINPPLYEEEKRKQPSRDAIIRIGIALGSALEDLDELLMAAAYAPLVR